MKAYRQRPTPEGAELGKHLARLADTEEPNVRLKWPEMSPRCGTCAFKAGTIPNQMPGTLMDAVKCLMEFRPFLCHEHKEPGGAESPCMGWAILMMAKSDQTAPIEAPWPTFGIPKEEVTEIVEAPAEEAQA